MVGDDKYINLLLVNDNGFYAANWQDAVESLSIPRLRIKQVGELTEMEEAIESFKPDIILCDMLLPGGAKYGEELKRFESDETGHIAFVVALLHRILDEHPKLKIGAKTAGAIESERIAKDFYSKSDIGQWVAEQVAELRGTPAPATDAKEEPEMQQHPQKPPIDRQKELREYGRDTPDGLTPFSDRDDYYKDKPGSRRDR